MAKIAETVFENTKPLIEKAGYELYDVEYVKEGPDYFLRIYIDKEGGITFSDCEKATEAVNGYIDSLPLKDHFYLEVSSPGIERQLRRTFHFLSCIGSTVKIKFTGETEGKKEMEGLLLAADEHEICMEVPDYGQVVVERIKIKKANLVWKEGAN